jgi:hypothetical protein
MSGVCSMMLIVPERSLSTDAGSLFYDAYSPWEKSEHRCRVSVLWCLWSLREVWAQMSGFCSMMLIVPEIGMSTDVGFLFWFEARRIPNIRTNSSVDRSCFSWNLALNMRREATLSPHAQRTAQACDAMLSHMSTFALNASSEGIIYWTCSVLMIRFE